MCAMRTARGFTLIELLVVLSILALLLALAAPRYVNSLDKARDVAVQENLQVMRIGIDRFRADRGRYPQGLNELVSYRYLRRIPVDPATGSADTWQTVPVDQPGETGIGDVRSGAQGVDYAGVRYAER